MGILDEAIKEHLELKRQHGADQSELKKLEDEAFGAAERPGSEPSASDAAAEAPTEFMAQPDLDQAEEPVAQAPASEADAPAAKSESGASPVEEAPSRGRTEIADLQEPPAESVEQAEEQVGSAPEPVEEASAAEHEAIADLPAQEPAPEPAGPTTEERHAIAEHPTEMYDVEAELGDAEPPDAEPEVHALSEEDEEFWDEKRLSDELDQALEAPVELEEPRIEATPKAEPEPRAEPEPTEEDEPPSRPEGEEHDVLDETPDFLEESPADEQLWFEQKPPKDFDFDD